MSITKHAFIIPLFLSIILTIPLHARILNVPDDHETIQGGIDASEDGDTVLVQPGEYVENIDFDGKGITVASLLLTTALENYIDSTVIDGSSEQESVVRFMNDEDENSILTGFTLTGGRGHLEGQYLGGGIYCTSSPSITHLKVIDNFAWFGGGIYITGGLPTISHVTVTRNSVRTSGGGIYCSNRSRPVISYVLVCDNEASSFGGGVSCYNASRPVLINVTIVGNRAEHEQSGGLVTQLQNHPILVNCIIRDNEPRSIHLGAEANAVRDSVSIYYSDIEGGVDEIGLGPLDGVNWGEGNIDADPLFVDPDEGDYHLTADSPCIDAGDPESNPDPDGSRADMGAFPFYYNRSIMQGFVLDGTDDSPIDSARIDAIGERGFSAESWTNDEGFFRMALDHLLAQDFSLTASKPDFIDSTMVGLQVDIDDTLEVVFRLFQARFSLTVHSVNVDLQEGDSTHIFFAIINSGDRPLEWEAERRFIGEANIPQWGYRSSINIGEAADDDHIEGVVFVDEHFFVTGRNYENPIVYKFDREGILVGSFPQFELDDRRGMRDLAWDGDLIWGSLDRTVYGFTTEGELSVSFDGPFRPIAAVTYDPQLDVLWIASTTTDITAVTREGEVIDSLQVSRQDLRIYGLAYWEDDPDGFNLYAFSKERGDTNRQIVHKFNPVTGDTLFVAYLDPEMDASPGGAFITDQFHHWGNWVFMAVASAGRNAGGDRIDIWQMWANIDWMQIEPQMAGELPPQRRQDLVLILDASGMRPDVYMAELFFRHNARRGQYSLPITLTVTPADVRQEAGSVLPSDFGITGVYPNPFNAATQILYTVRQSSNVTLRIYDTSGRCVTTLVDGFVTAGTHTANWDAEKATSGVYLCRMEHQDGTTAKKLIILK